MPEDAALLEAVEAIGPATTAEIADLVGCSARAAEFRLRKLYAEGAVESETVGTTFVWRPAEDPPAGEINGSA